MLNYKGSFKFTYTAIYIHILIYFSRPQILNIEKIFKTPVSKKILNFENILSDKLNVSHCNYYQPFEIVSSETITDFDVVFLNVDRHSAFMRRYRLGKHSVKKNMVIFTMEPPHSVRFQFNYQISKDYFNHWVYSYHRSNYFYGPYGDYTEKKNLNYSLKEISDEFKTRKNAAFSVISNCHFIKSKRIEYIKYLQKYFKVDTFGNCFGSRITKEERDIKMSKYKYFIAAENSHCKEYTTEKYWGTLERGAIPILIGYPTNLTALIPGSFINAFDFRHPRDLAKYLEKVSTDIDEYFKFHSWRKKYFIPYNRFDTCKILDTVTKYLNQEDADDPTIHEMANESVCMDSEQAFNLLVQE
ncbi:hypothetical protein MXB_2895 [Myxobolus squamalis]|nr:hypothetical protein MXB_2895 [Myxobolus squamalis]